MTDTAMRGHGLLDDKVVVVTAPADVRRGRSKLAGSERERVAANPRNGAAGSLRNVSTP